MDSISSFFNNHITMSHPANDRLIDDQRDYLDDLRTETVSNCCGTGHFGDNMICEECGEHCSSEKE